MIRIFIIEAIKITLFCLIVTGLYWLLGASQGTILIMFNVAVMACAATFSPQKKSLALIFEGVVVILFAIISGAVIGFYLPVISKAMSIIFAVLAFKLPKTNVQKNVFVTAAVMFLIFTALPFDFSQGVVNAVYGLLMIPLILIFYKIFDSHIYSETTITHNQDYHDQKKLACIAGISLMGAWIAAAILKRYTSMTHLYWIGLTVLMVLQGSQGKTIKISLLRIGVNTAGALFIVILMTYIIPANFWINFCVLVVFLFAIFALGFSYILRTLFIELFVLSFTHLLGQYHNIIAYDRVLLTLIGGMLVIAASLLVYIYRV